MAKFKITVPNNFIAIGAPDSDVNFVFESFVMWALNCDTRFNSSGVGIRAAVRVENELMKLPPIAKSGDDQPVREMVLQDSDRTLLLECLDSPQQEYPIRPARILLPWIDAVRDATRIEE